MTFLEGLLAVDLKWKLATALGGVFLLTTQCGSDGRSTTIPDSLEKGSLLLGFQLAGEEAVYDESGIEVIDVEGDWVQVRFGQDKGTDRWFNFGEMAAFMLAPR